MDLICATVADDRAAVRRLLRSDPGLAVCTVRKRDRYEAPVAHWIYAGDTALHAAAAGCRVEVGRLILAAGADVAAAGNRRRSQPLHYAADGCPEGPAWDPARQVAMIKLLIEAGASLSAQDKNGATPLHRAVRTRCAQAVRCLLGAGADPMIRNGAGSTAFHLAAQNTGRGGSGTDQARAAQLDILQAFLERGVRPTIEDAQGRSVLKWAKSDRVRRVLATTRG